MKTVVFLSHAGGYSLKWCVFNGSNDKNDQWCFIILYGFIMVDHNMEAEKHGKTGSMSSIFDFMGNMTLIFTLW
jgi:hypothetical protein